MLDLISDNASANTLWEWLSFSRNLTLASLPFESAIIEVCVSIVDKIEMRFVFKFERAVSFESFPASIAALIDACSDAMVSSFELLDSKIEVSGEASCF
jgi:hypothetical protein